MMSTSQSTVARMGRELALQQMEEGKPVAYITGLDGKMYPASQFDRNGMVNALVEAMKADPDASLRSIASKAGCSPATVLRYRRWFDESGRLDEWRSADADDSAEHDWTGR